MTREKMLNKLGEIDYLELWPSDDWSDIGFTERRIWLNRSGYGYIACDEPDVYYKISKVPAHKWHMIRDKLARKQLTIDDIQGTSLSKLDYAFSDDLNEDLKGLLLLPETMDEYFFCAVTLDGNIFYNTEAEILEDIKRDECDVFWTDLLDSELEKWVNRLKSIPMGFESFCDLVDEGK